ncbi:MAG: zincin-like metallopeptidase domain-containing protein [Pseudomonadota bacterium]
MSQTHQQPASGASRVSLYEEVTDRIIGELEQGRVPWVQPWDVSGVTIGLPRSAATRKFYSGINVLILWEAVIRRGFAAQEWLTFRQALSLGAHVRKGERGTNICYADSFIPKAERERAKEQGTDPNAVPFLKRFTVFNIEQCEGLPAHVLDKVTPTPDADKYPVAEHLIAATGATIREGGGEAYYHRSEDFIRLPPRASFIGTADFYCTALHELGHWTAHPSRLARNLANRFGSSAYAREEMIAELTSAFLCAHLNIAPQIRHTDYLAHWLAILKEDARAIFHAASQASKASDFLLAFQPTPEIPPHETVEQEP